jgi:hypothetical protein
VEPAVVGFGLTGGASAPYPGLISEGARDNTLRLVAKDDRIVGYLVGIGATAGTRFGAMLGPSNGNRLVLDLEGLRLESLGADLGLRGTRSQGEFAAGDDNVLRLTMRGTTGSGPRANGYWNEWSPLDMAPAGTGNRIEVTGTAEAFSASNPGIDPPPPAAHFTGE